MAKDFKSSVHTIKRVLNIDLKKKCYRKITAQKLKEDQKPIKHAVNGLGRTSVIIN